MPLGRRPAEAGFAGPERRRQCAGRQDAHGRQVRSTRAGGKPAGKRRRWQEATPAVPQVVDRESSQQPPDEERQPTTASDQARLKPPAARSRQRRWPARRQEQPGVPPNAEDVEEAVVKQQDLLAEFEKIADELNSVLANLEGSTLVKRLKAASRLQYRSPGGSAIRFSDAFGVLPRQPGRRAREGARRALRARGEGEPRRLADHGRHAVVLRAPTVHAVQDRPRRDAEARRRSAACASSATTSRRRTGLSIAQCEFWSDTLDRWAEDLVDPLHAASAPARNRRQPAALDRAGSAADPGGRGQPPRGDPRRRAGQAGACGRRISASRPASCRRRRTACRPRRKGDRADHRQLPDARDRVRLRDRPAGPGLRRHDRGDRDPRQARDRIAWRSPPRPRRSSCSSSPSGSTRTAGVAVVEPRRRRRTGKTNDSAMALLGRASTRKEVREDRGVSQATGESGPVLPEEFRSGLDEYFNKLERGTKPKPGSGGQ